MAALLDLVRKLIDYGKELAATLQNDAAENPYFSCRAFGTRDLTLILASITRGLHRATALESRLVPLAARPKKQPVQPSAVQRRPRPSRPARSRNEDLPLPQLPTPEQIAAEVRRRPIGAVIADICRDLGILPNHPLWRDLRKAIMHHGGSYVRLLKDIITQPSLSLAESAAPSEPPAFPSSLAPASTGPP
jgi:hypothetical protein